jgi:hypothetical protein
MVLAVLEPPASVALMLLPGMGVLIVPVVGNVLSVRDVTYLPVTTVSDVGGQVLVAALSLASPP